MIVILTDDQGYGDLSCTGNPVLKTPSTDRLAAESVRFTDFHVAPVCTPTRGQLMTGMDALHNLACAVTSGRTLIRRDIPTMAGYFQKGGYRTGLFGKWHLGDTYPYLPQNLQGLSKIIEVKGLSCRPCSKLGYDECPKKHFRCMKDISESEIIDAL